MSPTRSYILPIAAEETSLDCAGGKGMNLSVLLQAGFPVPAGFIITTLAYDKYVKHNNLSGSILDLLAAAEMDDTESLDKISSQIRAQFDGGSVPAYLGQRIISAWNEMGAIPVAVRSSATAEDLPGISFAGQQDTLLNITNEDDLIAAVVTSWSSLWTARAIAYRTRYGIPQDQVSMAVVIQQMVPSFCSGVMFTANPLNGSRNEMVIDATFGIGEALVSGQVEPDHYVVNTSNNSVLERQTGSKEVAMYVRESGGFNTLQISAGDEGVLTDEQIMELTRLGGEIAEVYGFPQDIEWAISGGNTFILQSRPITSLYPLPEDAERDQLSVYFSFAAIQGLLDPITPSGQDALGLLFAGGARMFDLDHDHHSQPIIKCAGERMWMNITQALSNPIGSRIMRNFVTIVDPSIVDVINELLEDDKSEFGKGAPQFSTLRRFLGFMLPFLGRVSGYLRAPEGKAAATRKASLDEIARLKDKYPGTEDATIGSEEILALFQEIRESFIFAVPHIAAPAGGGILPLFLLNKLCRRITGSNQLALEITRGLPNNVTTEMDLHLWEVAKAIKSDQNSAEHFFQTEPGQLVEEFESSKLPEPALSAISGFMEIYGMRGLGEIDLGRKRWREDPTYIFEVLLSYMKIDDASLAPDVIFKEGKRTAENAIRELQSIARGTFAGGIKSRLIGSLATRVRALAGLRESPKFHIIQVMGVIRQGLLSSGQQLAREGVLADPEDIFYLYYDELVEVVEKEQRDWQELVKGRKQVYENEMLRKQIPRLLLSDGRAYYEGISSLQSDEERLVGSPVSPGTVAGKARIVVDPLRADLQPGEILVCRGTDPAWTPLFLTAGGLVMEVGGMMTHGAIVAREYGIPAVVGITRATEVLKTGQSIQVNGSNGEILFLET